MEILPVELSKEMIPSIIAKHLSCKNCTIKDVNYLIEHLQFVELVIKIKRAFGLKPRTIPQNYIVNLRTGTINRIHSLPELTKLDIPHYVPLKPVLRKEDVISIVKKTAFKYATRAYKFFWEPEIIIKRQETLQLLIWQVNCFAETENKVLWINSYTGQVSVPDEIVTSSEQH